ncbi:MAG TPA: oligosaccharide flippase family protein [Candidatus Limnocylindria bacterium]|jgi:O-antigen/teichoic acid export membrane protein
MSRLSLLDKTKPAQGDAVAEPSGEASRPVTRGAFAMLSTQPLTWAVSLAAIALVPRYLGDDGLGRFAIAWTIGGYIGLAATLGLPNYVTRKVAMEPAKAATYAWGAVVVMTLMFIPLASAVLAALATFHPAAVDEWLVIVGMSETFVWSAQGILMASFVGQQRHVHYAWWAASASAFVTAVGLATLLAGGDVHMYAGAVFIATVAITAAQWALSGLGFTRASLVPGILRELVVGGLPFLWWNVALRIRDNADVVMTGLLIRPGVAGWLSAGYRIIGITVFIPTVITTPLLPVLSKLKGDVSEYRAVLRDSVTTVMLLTVPVSGMIFSFAPSIPDLLGWPVELQQSVPVIQILAFQQVLIGVDMVLATSLIALARERRWLRVALAASVFNLAVNLVAIPAAQAIGGNGAAGAAIVEVATELVFLSCAIFLTPRGLLGYDLLLHATRTAACGLILVAVAGFLRPHSLILAFAAGGAAYLVAALALGVLRPAHLRAVRLALRPA